MMKKPTRMGRATLALAAGLGALLLSGCPNPNDIGVQQYGTVVVTCLQASNRQPVAGAYVKAAGTATQQEVVPTDGSGRATLTQVVIGSQPIHADAPGLSGDTTVTVIQDQTVSAQILMTPTN